MASWNRTLERNGLMPFTITYDFRKLPGRTFTQPDTTATDTSPTKHLPHGHFLNCHFANQTYPRRILLWVTFTKPDTSSVDTPSTRYTFLIHFYNIRPYIYKLWLCFPIPKEIRREIKKQHFLQISRTQLIKA